MTSLLRSSAVALHLVRLQTKPTALARNFSALASTTGHWNNVLRPQFVAEPIMQVAVRTFKDMDVLTKRCKDCYFKKGDDRWYVLCKTHGRHKQRQRLPDERHFWIVTHKTHGPKKRF